MLYDTIIAIDPGASGGIVTFRDKKITCVKIGDQDGLIDYFRHIKDISKNPICFMERVQMWGQDAKEPGKIFGINKMLAGFERLKNTLGFSKIPYCLVASVSWQKYHNLKMTTPESDTEKKNRFKMYAQQIFTKTDVRLWNADALLILAFAVHKIEHDPAWLADKINGSNNLFT